MSDPLVGLRVVDASLGIAGGYATKLLADAGADVVRLEAAPSDPPEQRLLFAHLHAGKRRGAGAVDADVIVVGSDDGRTPDRDVASQNPSAVRVTISPFGAGGPWSGRPATDFTLQAWCGSLEMRAFGGRPPVAAGGAPGLFAAGAMAALGAVAHLGRGVELDVSIFEVMTGLFGTSCLEPQLARDEGPQSRAPEVPSIEPAKDGMVGFGIVTAQQWSDFCVLVEHPEWVDDARFATMAGRFQHLDEVRAGIESWMRRHTVAEVVEGAALFRIPVVPVGNGASVADIECYREGGTFAPSAAGDFLAPRSPLRFAAPGLRVATPARSDAALPLHDIRVADFTAFWAGPYASQLLALLGADVVHVESMKRPDGMRMRSVRDPSQPNWWEWAPIFHAVNASKRSLTLDLDQRAGLELAERLVSRSDLVIENFSPRVMDGWGFDAEGLARRNPDAVMVRMPAFGLEGPWRDRTGFQMTMEQMSGIAWVTGWDDERPWCPYVCDATAGIHAAFAAVCGLEQRRRGGAGQVVEVRMCEVAAALAAEQIVEWTGNGRLLGRRGNAGEPGDLQDVFRSADDEWLAVTVPAADRERFEQRVGISCEELADWSALRGVDAAVAELWEAGFAVARVTSGRVAHENPQHLARGFHQRQMHPLCGELLLPGLPMRVSSGPEPRHHSAAPTLGNANREVLCGWLGTDDEAYRKLEEQSVVGEVIAGGRSM